MTQHPRLLTAIALVTLGALTLTGCLVKKEAQKPPLNRKQDNLRVYEDGDWILYNVTALNTSSSKTLTGTLRISWAGPFQLPPPDGRVTSYNVMKKVIEVNIDGSANPNGTGTAHYIQQATDGTEQLVAMEPVGSNQYWLNTFGGSQFAGISEETGESRLAGEQEPVTTLESPLFVGQNYSVEYTLMNDCTTGTGTCKSDIGTSTNTIEVVGDSTQRNTNIGNYANPFQIRTAGGIAPAAGIASLPMLFDIFDVCSDAQSIHDATLYIVPEIGVLQLSNLCTDISSGGEIIQYTITIDSLSSNIQ